MVVMTPGATEPQIQAVVKRLETTGVHVLVMPGELTTAIGAIGDPEGVRSLALEGMPGVDQVIPISRPYKLASSEFGHREATRQQVVAGEARLHVLDIADLRGAGDVFEEYDFHEMLLTKERRLRVPGLVAEETGQTPTP